MILVVHAVDNKSEGLKIFNWVLERWHLNSTKQSFCIREADLPIRSQQQRKHWEKTTVHLFVVV